ncbi:MAG: hypothetical protein GFH27_549281n117 [Chloroflexi bacterium AL-W]|nr:hypothetical protein [Chloroflexi bacterium AL-N1]NOK66003.1 hypothetical protein [Chloroflexi bacterium AL-N10]NOK72884.1 hypothetical protein [Chloroflexi bacterium AL-N5]NOK79781.1 hypothetical protein [Chloroflexi bacterium AL-W]NOK88363.1 hypothetical protein [Chloroflexi bacterium AL-N15]
MQDDTTLQEIATMQGIDITQVRSTLLALHTQIGNERLYIFWVTRKGAKPASGQRERVLLAFTTPDVAIAFAQRNGLAPNPSELRLRRLSVTQLVLAMVRDESIRELIVAADLATEVIGTFPEGFQLKRSDLLQQFLDTTV